MEINARNVKYKTAKNVYPQNIVQSANLDISSTITSFFYRFTNEYLRYY